MQTNLIERNNIKIIGSGSETIVFAHGFGCDQNMWRFVAPAFEDRFRVVLFDYVGAGKSDIALYREKGDVVEQSSSEIWQSVCEATRSAVAQSGGVIVMNKPLFPEVTVNGHVISAADLAAEAQNHSAPKGKPGLAWRQAAQALVIRQLLLDEADRLSLKTSPQDLGGQRFETEEEALIRAVMEAGIVPAAMEVMDRPSRLAMRS